ncbi:hypothetical protein SAMN04488564_102129 [Lentzea waywayandensis]|uniref:Fe-S cluster biogenesis protein NfuA, 4Fe-4S-binding domain n=1 Tax=Lentzea waywayandensis TaxID=84724 RepID=A0A1I6DAP4_9PSEU|nr:hypothetical protein [Lentzea waywayandensis]SFR02530.1 hypothetical protein SAMN04488564_102129 [Lentzea waywayandensis]
MNHDVRAAGDRIEELLGTLRSGPARDSAEELVRLLMALYGEGLARVLAILREHDPALVARIAEDDLLEDLLLLHDLHPRDASARIRRVLDGLGALGPLENLGIDADGVVRIRLTASGCHRSAAARTVEQAVLDAVPEATRVEVVTAAPDTLLQIGMRPPPGWRLEVAS